MIRALRYGSACNAVRVADGVLIFVILGAFYGFLYPLVVGVALALCALAQRRFRPRPRDWIPLAFPAATYYGLAYLVWERQGWNLPDAVLALAGVGSAVVVVACLALRPRWLLIGAVLGVGVAVGLWWLVPHAALNRLF